MDQLSLCSLRYDFYQRAAFLEWGALEADGQELLNDFDIGPGVAGEVVRTEAAAANEGARKEDLIGKVLAHRSMGRQVAACLIHHQIGHLLGRLHMLFLPNMHKSFASLLYRAFLPPSMIKFSFLSIWLPLILFSTGLFATPLEELSFLELRARPSNDLAAQRRLVELGDGATIQICLEQLFSEDPQLCESAVLVLGGSKQDRLVPVLLRWLSHFSAGQIALADRRGGEPMARVAVQLLQVSGKATPAVRTAAERLAHRDGATQLRKLCAWVQASGARIQMEEIPDSTVGLE